MIVTCPPCFVCGATSVLDGVDALGFVEWQQLGKPIQNALPDLDSDQRELLVTGTHAHCWAKVFGGDDE
jgi:tRNA(Arg) A34 adenosine deaminase TadA